ncbi:MAG: heme o synthase [Phaeodactylibacter sp.]|nr:heme o synthase [Phaeodactylibacter sp.]MCB9273525.1 protoheme IX farnesyltransferase [Lewinellaceae bacterium]
MLVKFRLSMTVVFSSVMAYLIADTGPVNWVALAILASGGFLVTGAANALNQVLEKDYDRLMKRTANRPVAAGRMKMSEAVMSAGLMSLFGITLLALFNPWTAFFGTFALVSYAFLYTPMKRLSPSAVVVGAVPGALPTLIGCVAAQGELTALGLSLFALQFFWQFPHFWSIGWLGYEDYAKAGYRLMPEREGQRGRSIRMQAFVYTLFLLPVSATPYLLGETGPVSLVIVLAVTLGYIYFGWNFFKAGGRKPALGLMFYSFIYIPASLIAFFADKL